MSALEDKVFRWALVLKCFLDRFPKSYNIYVVASISCLAGLMFGIDISSVSAFLDTEQYVTFFNHPGATIQGVITASMALGSFFGALISSFVSDPLGRRASLMFSALFWVIGSAIQSSVQNRTQLCLGRVISGLGVGFGSSVAPVYSSELAPRKIRGTIVGMFQFSVALGILIMYFVSYGLQHIKRPTSFRAAWGLQMVPGVLLLIGCLFIPESPRWLAKHGHWDECEQIVAGIQAKGNREDTEVMVEISEIKDQILSDEECASFSYLQLFSKRYIFRTTTCVFAQIWQQLTGMNVMMYYIVYIFQMAGYEGNANLVASSIQYVLFVAATAPALYFLDKLGRRPMLLGGAVLMMALQFVVGSLLAVYSEPIAGLADDATVRIRIPEANKPAATGVIASCYLFNIVFAFTWGVGIWVYVSEVSGDSRIRTKIVSMATAANWALNFSLALFVPPAFKNISWKTYFIFGAFCGAMAIHVYFAFPETKGRRLEEMAEIWDNNIPAWRSAAYTPHVPDIGSAEDSGEEKEKTEFEHVEDNNFSRSSS